MKTIKKRYIRRYDVERIPKDDPCASHKVGLFVLVKSNDGDYAVGHSFCNTAKDHFSKNLANVIAEGRAMNILKFGKKSGKSLDIIRTDIKDDYLYAIKPHTINPLYSKSYLAFVNDAQHLLTGHNGEVQNGG